MGDERVMIEAHVHTAVALSGTSSTQPIEIMFGDTTDVVVKDESSGWLFESRMLDVALHGQMAPRLEGTA